MSCFTYEIVDDNKLSIIMVGYVRLENSSRDTLETELLCFRDETNAIRAALFHYPKQILKEFQIESSITPEDCSLSGFRLKPCKETYLDSFPSRIDKILI